MSPSWNVWKRRVRQPLANRPPTGRLYVRVRTPPYGTACKADTGKSEQALTVETEEAAVPAYDVVVNPDPHHLAHLSEPVGDVHVFTRR